MNQSIPILRIGRHLLVSVQSDLGDEVAEAFQTDVLERIDRTGAPGLLVDISALDVVDTYVARVIVDTAKMAKLMGTATVVVGMRPEVAATLIYMNYPFTGVATALDVDDGLAELDRIIANPTRR